MVVALLIGALVAPPAGATPSYTLIGGGDERPRPGAAAGKTALRAGVGAFAVRSDGVIAFEDDDRIWWVQDGLLTRVVRGAAGVTDMAFASDGSLLVTTCGPKPIPSALWRTAPGQAPTLVVGRWGRSGSSGDGGPATEALLNCPNAVDVQSDGSILISDVFAHRIRRVGADGIIHTVAGTGREASSGDGGPAVNADVWPVDVAALPDGGFAVVDVGPKSPYPPNSWPGVGYRVRLVDSNGVITTRWKGPIAGIAGEPTGALLVSVDQGDALVRRLWPDGRLELVADPNRDRAGIPTELPVAGDPFGVEEIDAGPIAASPDGGVLMVNSRFDYQIDYIPPPVPQLLALAILPETRVPAPRALAVVLRSTRPAQLKIDVRRDGRRVATAAAQMAAGDATVPISTSLKEGLHEVRVEARDGGQVAVARAQVLVGGRLPFKYARNFIYSRLELFRVLEDAPNFKLRCHRVSRRRVDCGVIQRRRCAAVVSVRVRADGTLATGQYSGGRGRRCRIRRYAQLDLDARRARSGTKRSAGGSIALSGAPQQRLR